MQACEIQDLLGRSGSSGKPQPPHRRLYSAIGTSFDKIEEGMRRQSAACGGPTSRPMAVIRIDEAAVLSKEDWSDRLAAAGDAWVVVCVPRQGIEGSAPDTDVRSMLRSLAITMLCSQMIRPGLRCFVAIDGFAGAAATTSARRYFDEIGAPPTASRAGLPTVIRCLMHQDGCVGVLVLDSEGSCEAVRLSSTDDAVGDDGQEVAAGDLATYQERVFNSDKDIAEVRFDAKSFGSGETFVKVISDALKWNVYAHAFDLANSSCGGAPLLRALKSILHTNRYLRTLLLDQCSITDAAGVELGRLLATAEFIETVSLARNPGIGSDTLCCLGASLGASSATKLRRLCLDGNNSLYIDDLRWTDAAIAELFEGLGRVRTLTSLSVVRCGLTARDAVVLCNRFLLPKRLGPSATPLESLDVSHNALGDVAAVCIVDGIDHISTLGLASTGVGPRGLRAIASALAQGPSGVTRRIGALDLSSCDADPRSAAGPQEMPFAVESLGRVTLEHVAEPQQPQEHVLAACGAVVRLRTSAAVNFFTKGVDSSSFDADDGTEEAASARSPAATLAYCLAGNTDLQRLTLRCASVGDEGVVSLCDRVLCQPPKEGAVGESDRSCSLRHIDLHGNVNLSENGCAHKIKEVVAGGYDRGASQWQPTIESLDVSDTCLAVGERAILALRANPGTLRSLSIAGLDLPDGALVPFATLIPRNAATVLTSLDLSNNAVRTDGLRSITQWIRHGASLVRHLYLRNVWKEFDDVAGRRVTLATSPGHGAVMLAPLLLLLRHPPPHSTDTVVPDIQQAAEIFAAVAKDVAETVEESMVGAGAPESSSNVRVLKSSPMARLRMQEMLRRREASGSGTKAIAVNAISGGDTPDEEILANFTPAPVAHMVLETLDLRGNCVDYLLARVLSSCVSATDAAPNLIIDVRDNPCEADLARCPLPRMKCEA